MKGIVIETDAKVDVDLLRDLFYVDLPPEPDDTDRGTGSDGRKGKTSKPPAVPPVNPSPKYLNISRIADGQFGLRIRPGPGHKPGNRYRVKMAYDIRRGNPFSKYDRRDFDLSDRNGLHIRQQGATVEGRGNTLTFNADGPSFDISITGFDRNRDLRFREQRVAHSTEATE